MDRRDFIKGAAMFSVLPISYPADIKVGDNVTKHKQMLVFKGFTKEEVDQFKETLAEFAASPNAIIVVRIPPGADKSIEHIKLSE